MVIKLTRKEAVASAIASVRMEGLVLAPAHQAILDKLADGELSCEQAKQAILKTIPCVLTEQDQHKLL
jgi:hypothetical protein